MIAIIPARGGSKGLVGKNIKFLKGKPLIAYTIEAALNSSYITHVVVNTDDEDIARVALAYGAEVPFLRPDYLATDKAKSVDVFKHGLLELENVYNKSINEIIVLQPTSPLRTSMDIDAAILLFKDRNADSVISYCQEHHPIIWHKYIDENGNFESIFDENIDNRQAIRPTYYPNGAIYILKKELLFQNKYYTSKSIAYIMNRENSIDIDTIEDFEYCEFLMSRNA